MDWEITGGASVNANPGGGYTVTIPKKNSDGDTQTIETTKDAAGNEIHKKTTTNWANGNKTIDETTTDIGPPVKTKKKLEESKGKNPTITEITELENGVKRKFCRTYLYSNKN